MPYDLFWNGDPDLVRIYRESHQKKMELRNQEMWAQGLYNFRAFRAVAEAITYGLSGGKGSKPSNYPEEPLPFTESEQKAATERNKQRTLNWVQENQK
jgi:hypothetical protein